ncbi:ABC transporter ATP-binding protein [Nocardia terpenica]|uniref:ABC transporter ATP-binding protein n=2 Tax=Nocardia terpenica TaxID=455432 RepID=A0A0U1YZE5_9NOCA|nr:ABC transporter ATP-binding protein [Nocardia terpenica]AJO72722.1 Antibiotic ABC transporter ATPase [Nocardia terpenica]ATL66152.1 ABC transporter ATP-binding protein [Nocardia terpenica]KZM75344.1 bacteriocin ABC transporter ATP-binding protein [Nocardia terpenica]MBF6063716.1 ABC transporter ATP-binding protein [Nocardia terpenica]MBF6107092.1 ABC transporter ATP-binding protein [Nocardia terpenica]
MSQDVAVEVRDLVKRYPGADTNAVDSLSFTVQPGEVFGLLGPNGAGKTTTVGVLTTRVRPTSGYASVCGVDVLEDPIGARRVLAAVSQRNTLDGSLTIRQNLLFHARYHRIPRAERARLADEILERMSLTPVANRNIGQISGGQTQRVMIGRALMHKPDVLFLDEPANGLDPQARLFVHDRVVDLHRDGTAVVITTHDMSEATKLCNRVGIVDHGRMLALDTPAKLTELLPGSSSVTLTIGRNESAVEKAQDVLATIPVVRRVEPIEGTAETAEETIRLYSDSAAPQVVKAALDMLADGGWEVRDVTIGKPGLEDVFIELTGRDLR